MSVIGGAASPTTMTGIWGIESGYQMSTFSTISIAPSTSMPRFRSAFSTFEWLRGCDKPNIGVEPIAGRGLRHDARSNDEVSEALAVVAFLRVAPEQRL